MHQLRGADLGCVPDPVVSDTMLSLIHIQYYHILDSIVELKGKFVVFLPYQNTSVFVTAFSVC